MTKSGASSASTDIRIRWERRAVKEVKVLPEGERRRIVAAVENLRENPTSGPPLSAEWKGFRRLRVGPYRIVYAYNRRELLISVVRVGHRRDVYR